MAHLTLGGRDRELRFTWKALRRLRNEQEVNLLAGDLSEEMFMDPQTVTALVWGACLHESPGLTLDEVDEWITLPALGTVATALASAIQEALTPIASSSTT